MVRFSAIPVRSARRAMVSEENSERSSHGPMKHLPVSRTRGKDHETKFVVAQGSGGISRSVVVVGFSGMWRGLVHGCGMRQ